MEREWTRSNPLLSELKIRESKQSIVNFSPQSREGYTPNEAAKVIESWNEYSIRMQELVSRTIQEAKDKPSRQIDGRGRNIIEAAISLYSVAIENHYSRISRPNPNKIVSPVIHHLSSAELILIHMRLCSVVDFLFKCLLAETNYNKTGVASWNMVYLAMDVTLGRQKIIKESL